MLLFQNSVPKFEVQFPCELARRPDAPGVCRRWTAIPAQSKDPGTKGESKGRFNQTFELSTVSLCFVACSLVIFLMRCRCCIDLSTRIHGHCHSTMFTSPATLTVTQEQITVCSVPSENGQKFPVPSCRTSTRMTETFHRRRFQAPS